MGVRRRKKIEPGLVLSQLQRKFLLLLILPLLYLMFVAWQQATSALFDYQSQRWLEYWLEQSQSRKIFIIQNSDYQVALNGAHKALAKQPRKAEYMERLGSIYDWYVMSGRRDKPEYEEALSQSLNYFRAATQARPFWPESWFNLALAKARQRQLDEEFDRAFLRALELGPWEERLQLRAAGLGLLLYDWVSPIVKQAAQDNWQRMARHQPGVFLGLIREKNAWQRLCEYYVEQPRQCVKNNVQVL